MSGGFASSHHLPTGRRVEIDVSADMTLDEFRAICGFVAADMPRELARASGVGVGESGTSASEPVVDIVAERRRRKAAEPPAVN